MAKVNINKNKSISGGTLYSTDTTHTLATAHDIYDEKRECYVEDYDFGVKTINGSAPDENGNFNLPVPPTQVQSNWTETNTSASSYILNKPNLATVATSGNYNDLRNLPAKGVQSVNGVAPDSNGNVNTPDTKYSPGAGINISGTEISNSGVRSLTQNGSVITVNTGGNTSTITIPESGKIDNISINNKNVTISNKTAQLPVVTITAWNESSDNTTTFSFVGQKNS